MKFTYLITVNAVVAQAMSVVFFSSAMYLWMNKLQTSTWSKYRTRYMCWCMYTSFVLYSWRFSRYSARIHWLVHGHMTSNNETVGNISKTMTSNGKQFTITREMLTSVARDQRWPDVVAGMSARFSIFSFVLCCYLTNHLMTGPLGNSEFCFPRISMFPSTSSWETLRFSGNKIHCSPRDQSLSANCFPPNMPGKTWKLTSSEKQFISPEEDVTILLFRPRNAKNVSDQPVYQD